MLTDEQEQDIFQRTETLQCATQLLDLATKLSASISVLCSADGTDGHGWIYAHDVHHRVSTSWIEGVAHVGSVADNDSDSCDRVRFVLLPVYAEPPR